MNAFGSTIIAGTDGNGVFKTDINEFTISGVNDISKNSQSAMIYPNPANNNILIKHQQGINQKLYIFNSLGEVISEFSVSADGDLFVNISNLPVGIYFCKMISGTLTKTEKFIIIR